MIDFVVDHDHGILVIENLGSTSLHEDWDVYADASHLQGDSLYVSVLPSMEDRVSTSVRGPSDAEPSRVGLTQIFEGELTISSNVLVFGDSDRNVEVRVPVISGHVKLSVYVDEAGLASKILVLLADGAA